MLKTIRKRFVVIEGIDKSGKSTLSRNLNATLSKLITNKVLCIGFPNRKSITGKIIDQYLNNKVSLNPQTSHLLFSANRWEEKDIFVENKHDIIICDRYWFSGAAYTTANGVDLKWAKSADIGLPCPDLVVFLDVRPTQAAERKDYGDEKYDQVSFQSNCYNLLKSLVREHPCGIVIDGNKDPLEIAQIIAEIIING